MRATGSCPLFLVFLLSFLLHLHLSLAFSLKNCMIVFPESPNNLTVLCKKRDLTVIPDDIPINVTSLDLSTNHILKITNTDLRCLSKLMSVRVNFNSISHVDDGAFVDLTELRTLSMSNNKLTNLTDNIFKGLFKLVTLTLSSNQISYISPRAFQSLVSIQSVELNNNRLHRITHITPILKLPTLHKLSISCNEFASFRSDDLPLHVSNLRSLELDMNPVRKFSIRKDIFPHLQFLSLCSYGREMEWDVANKTFLRSVTSLSLRQADVSFQPYSAVLQTTESLQVLHLKFMKTLIEKGLIDIACQIPSLRLLSVAFSDIHTINDTLLRSCSQVTELGFSYDTLSELSEHSFRSMTRLRFLSLNGNDLSQVPLALRGLSTLEMVDLSFNFISDLDCHGFLNLTKLTKLNLKHNRISKLHGCVFKYLTNLNVLNIEDNSVYKFYSAFKINLRKLESLNLHNHHLLNIMQGDFVGLSSLRVLDLESDTDAAVEDGAFEGLDNLQTLSVSLGSYRTELFIGIPQLENLTLHLTYDLNQRSFLQKDDAPFSNLPCLKKLVLKVYDQRQEVVSPDLLKGLKSLEYFTAEKFLIRSLHPDTFKYTPKLKDLHIVDSDLSDLTPELFWPIPNLQTLDLSNNNFRSLDFLARANLAALSWLKISENELSSINETVFQSLPALMYLDLTGNPLACECSNAGFNQWVQSNNQTQVVNGHQYTCAFPLSQQGNKFLDFDAHSCWIDGSFLYFLSSTCLVVFTLLASFIYHFLRWHLAYSYYLFLAFLYDKRRKASPHHYDAFVSYNIHDEAWVYREMLPVLEGEQGWRLCLHHRDFEPGKPIVENITDAIYGSRKTICVISRHYLQSEWCSREIQMASYRLFDEQEDVLILLFMEDIPAHQLSPYYRMRSLVKRRSYLSWPQAAQHTGVFWENIRRALDTADRPADNRHLLTGRPDFI
ncbi:toll-like receptor 13 [Acanthopagrus latus]|uniref:toll-like receptor 13 n=1 Tax=Acanthopagrus latus TaxID=8177 RepID=UPI00187CE5F8|nr:toll-like receptor 13 [Acanthopagrus latus]XP_036967293.1 toll-like receptor 13 [Acanthopagrus latus]